MPTKTLFYLAPIRGITDRVYRNCWMEQYGGLAGAITPFVQTVSGNQIKPAHLLENDPAQNQLPIIPQIIGRNASHFTDLTKQLADLGHQHINWNLACPSPTMTKKGRGAGLLPFPEEIDLFLDHVLGQTGMKLSVKMRLGLESPSEGQAVISVLNRYPLEHVTLHPRLGVQMYTGPVDLAAFAECCSQLKHPVTYSGDIFTLGDYQERQQQFPQIQHWMLGRGLLRNPFLLQEITDNTLIPLSKRIAKLRLFHKALFDLYCQRLSGPKHQLQRMYEHWMYWCHDLPNSEKLLKKVQRAKSLVAYSGKVERELDEVCALVD